MSKYICIYLAIKKQVEFSLSKLMQFATIFPLNFEYPELLFIIDLYFPIGLKKQLATVFSNSDILHCYADVTWFSGLLKPKRSAPKLTRKSEMSLVPFASAIVESMTFSWVYRFWFCCFLKACYRILKKLQWFKSLKPGHHWYILGGKGPSFMSCFRYDMACVTSSGLSAYLPTWYKRNSSFN